MIDSNPARRPIRAAILDDEPLARLRIKQLLAESEDIELAVELGDATEAAGSLHTLGIDLLFVDIEMPELDGFEVVEQLGIDVVPAVIFVTAHSEHALRAFEVRALDYLVKPFTNARFAESIERVRSALANLGPGEQTPQRLGPDGVLDDQRPLRRLPIRSAGRIRFLPVGEIDWIEAAGNRVKLHAGGAEHIIRRSLTDLAARLPRDRFVRVHRSSIVNVERVAELQPWSHGDYLVLLSNGSQVVSSRTYSARLREMLDL